MKSNRITFAIIAFLFAAVFAQNARAQFGDLINKAKNKIDKTQKKVEQTPNQTGNSNGGNMNNGGGINKNLQTAKLGQPGSIGLSKSPIDPQNWQAAKYENSFAANDNIYAIIFFGKPVTNLGTNDSNQEMIIWFDNGSGVLEDYWDIPIKPEQKNATFITLPINPAPSDVLSKADATAAERYLYFLKKYDNQKGGMRLLAGGEKQAGTVIGLDFTGGAAVADARFGQIKNAVAANSDRANAGNPLPKAGTNNPALERQFAAVINSQPHDWKLLKLIVTSADWQFIRHEISGAILNRYMTTRSVVKDPNGACRVLTIPLYQNSGGSGYGKTYMDLSIIGSSDDYPVSCDKAK